MQSGSFFNSSITFLSLSSNSPLYFVPATNDPISRVTNLLPNNVLGTCPEDIRCASPSTIAVLPTPGSPISTGLFFVLLLKIWITLEISGSRPIFGSSLDFVASSVRSTPNWSNVGVRVSFLASFLADFFGADSWFFAISDLTDSIVIPARFNKS